ncbi:MAG: hypothetical protein ACXVGC_01040 [Mycobacteriaceae bacterium]
MAALTKTGLGTGLAGFPGPRYARVRDNVYSAPLGSTYAGGRRPSGIGATGTFAIFKWDGTSAIGGITAYTSANAPSNGIVDVASHLDRLFVLGGCVPGTSGPSYKDRLYWSDIGGPVTNTLALWQDDVSGLVNQIVLDGGASNYGVGLANTQSGLMVFRRQSVDLLSGVTPANFALRRVLSIGCRATTSIVEYSGGVFFMSDDGFMWFDGSVERRVSDAVQPSFMAAARADNAMVHASLIGTDSLLVKVIRTDTSPNATTWSAIYHVPSGAWYDFTSNALLGGNRPLWSGRTVNFPYVTDGRVVYDASFVTQPTAVDKSLRGTETVPDTAVKSIIPAEMKTRVASLGLPMRTATLNRAYPQYILRTDVASNAGWSVTVEDEVGNILMPAVTLPPQANPSGAPQRQVASLEALSEATEAIFHFTYQSSSLRAAYDAELHDSYIEFSFGEDKTA